MRLAILTVLLLASSCGSMQMANSGESSNIEKADKIWVQKINESFKSADQDEFLKYVSSSYQKEQLKFLKYDTAQFLSELSCGNTRTGKYKCPDWTTINYWKVIKSINNDDGSKDLEIDIQLKNGELIKIKPLHLIKEDKKWKIVGAMG